MMDKARSVARSRFELFMKTLLAQERGECKEIVCEKERVRNYLNTHSPERGARLKIHPPVKSGRFCPS